jgi:hypothetical protein
MKDVNKDTQGLFRGIRTSVRYFAAMGLISTSVAVPLVLLQSHDLAAAEGLRQLFPKTVTVQSTPTSHKGLITAGPSRKNCVELPKLKLTNGAFPVTSGVKAFEAQTGTSVSCLTEYLNGAPTWTQWENPYITAPYEGVTTWIAGAPQSRQLVLQVDLIPVSLKNINDPLGWEQACASGQFDSYAQRLGVNLVEGGLQNSVIRLGAEMNGPWETDFIGTTTNEQHLWATCFSNEVAAMRHASGEHFLFDWNPSACYMNFPYVNYYPGNAYVDILGLDLYDASCTARDGSTVSWNQLTHEPAGLLAFESFAKMQGKPMSFPEWGLLPKPNGDDPAYVNGIGSTFAHEDFAFESYFDASNGGTLKIGPATPLSLAAFRKWFSIASKELYG